MSQLYVPLGLCFLECGCISSPSPFPGLTQASGHPGSRVRQGPRRAGPGLCAASLSPVDVCSVPFLSAAWRGAVPASVRAGHCQGPRGQQCTSFPLHPNQRPHWSLPSPLDLGAELTPGEGCSKAQNVPAAPGRGSRNLAKCAQSGEVFCPWLPSFQAVNGYPCLLPSTCSQGRWVFPLPASRWRSPPSPGGWGFQKTTEHSCKCLIPGGVWG